MARLAARMAAGLDVKQSVHVETVRRARAGWVLSWPARHSAPAGSIAADAVLLSAPVPQSAALLADHTTVPAVSYHPTISLLVAIDRPPSIRAPGGLQLDDHPTWSWIADNVAKGTSRRPSVTFHTRSEVAAARLEQDADSLTTDLLSAARPWLQHAEILDVVVHRWRYATPDAPPSQRCWTADGGRLVLAGDAFGGPRVEGAFLSGLAAASAIAGAAR